MESKTFNFFNIGTFALYIDWKRKIFTGTYFYLFPASESEISWIKAIFSVSDNKLYTRYKISETMYSTEANGMNFFSVMSGQVIQDYPNW
jgi:hypothetical protein